MYGGVVEISRDIVLVATADIHSPRYLSLFVEVLSRYNGDPDIVILAGDLVDRNKVEMFKPVYDRLIDRFNGRPIIAVYGNEEYRGYEDEYKRRYPGIRWLDDEYIILNIDDTSIGLIGTRGALDKPTPWQARNMPWLINYYRSLPGKIKEMINELKSRADYTIFVSHYGFTYETLIGEPRRIWPYLASRSIGEAVIGKVDIAIHGHAHNSKRLRVVIDGTEIYNVALPANKSLVEISIKPSRRLGLFRWIETG